MLRVSFSIFVALILSLPFTATHASDQYGDVPRRVYKFGLAINGSSSWWSVPVPYGSLNHYLSAADVVLIGEHHEDCASHLLELDVVDSLAHIHSPSEYRREQAPVVAMEMFERDVQPYLNMYIAAEIDESTFLQAGRPWNNYAENYRSIVELARDIQYEKWTEDALIGGVFASSAPTPIARRVAKEGLEAVLPTLSAEERGWIAETTTAPRDEYWQRFLAAMGGGASADAHSAGMSEEQIYRFYQAQCLKDDTMAETIARLRDADPSRQVVHLSGSFHIDYHLGIYPRLKQRRPEDKIVTVAIRPVADFDEATLGAALDAEPGVADYVVFVLREEPVAEAAVSAAIPDSGIEEL